LYASLKEVDNDAALLSESSKQALLVKDRANPRQGSQQTMTTRPPVQFGRRGIPGATSPVSRVAPPAAESARSEQTKQLLSIVKKMLIFISPAVAVPILLAVVSNPDQARLMLR
jgi:hypothetical protein